MKKKYYRKEKKKINTVYRYTPKKPKEEGEVALFEGIIEVKRGGFGFVRQSENDIFVPKERLNGAMNGDTVVVKQTRHADGGKTREGEVTRIIESTPRTVLGTFERNNNATFVLSDEPGMDDIYIAKNATLKARHGQKVVEQITKRAENGRSPEGKVIEILGFPGDKGVDVL